MTLLAGRREGQGLHRRAAAAAPGLLVTDAVLPLRATGVKPQGLGRWCPGSSEDHSSLTRAQGWHERPPRLSLTPCRLALDHTEE